MTKYLSYAALFLAAIIVGFTGTPEAAAASLATGLDPNLGLGTAVGLAGMGFSGMIMDEYSEFCDATALNTGAPATFLVGDVIDLGAAGEEPGNGHVVYLNIEVTTAVTSAGAATVQFELATDAAAAIAVDGSATTHILTDAIAKADLVAGYKLAIPLPLGGNKPYERYMGILQTTGTAALTAGAINAFLTLDAPAWKSYPDAVN